MTRLLVRMGLIISFLISIGVAYYAIATLGLEKSETWVLVAADLAVITSILATWSSQRVLELEEDAREPYIYFEFDPYSRYSLMQFRVKNSGGSPAYNIRFSLNRPVAKQGEERFLKFGSLDDVSHIPVLHSGDSVGQAIGASMWFFQHYVDTTFTGHVEFTNASGKVTKDKFVISAEQYRLSLVHETETNKALRDIQDIPDVLKEISRKLDHISNR